MITLVAKSPISGHELRKYMLGATRMLPEILIPRIKSQNPRLYTEMKLTGCDNKKLKMNFRTGLMDYKATYQNIECWSSAIYYIVKRMGVYYILTKENYKPEPFKTEE